jgi:hypothetical protein
MIPPDLLPVRNLKDFAPGATLPSYSNSIGRVSIEMHQFLLLFLSTLAYLHLPYAQNGSTVRFPLHSSDPTNAFNSQEVLFVLIRVLEYLCEVAYTPILKGDSLFGDYHYLPGALEECFERPPDSSLPSPMLFEATSGMMLYLISSSVLMGTRDSIPLVKKVQDIILNTVIPSLTRIGSVWPISKHFHHQLEVLVHDPHRRASSPFTF